MNIDDLTLKQLREISALVGNHSLSAQAPNPMLGKHCIIRTFSAGVHFGVVKQIDNRASAQGSDVLLENSRRIWKWEGAFTLSEVSQQGIEKASRIAEEVPEIYITGVIEIIPTTEQARKSFEKCNEK